MLNNTIVLSVIHLVFQWSKAKEVPRFFNSTRVAPFSCATILLTDVPRQVEPDDPTSVEQVINAADVAGAGAGIVNKTFDVFRLINYLPQYTVNPENFREPKVAANFCGRNCNI